MCSSDLRFNSIPAGLYFVSQNQINAQLPFNVLPGGTVNIVVTRSSSGTSAPQNVTVALTSPGIFTTTANGLGQAFAYDNTTGALAAPAGAAIGSFATGPHLSQFWPRLDHRMHGTWLGDPVYRQLRCRAPGQWSIPEHRADADCVDRRCAGEARLFPALAAIRQ